MARTKDEIHALLHRASVDVIHRSDEMISELVELDRRGKMTTRAVQAIVNRYEIPQIPAVCIIRVLTGKGVEL